MIGHEDPPVSPTPPNILSIVGTELRRGARHVAAPAGGDRGELNPERRELASEKETTHDSYTANGAARMMHSIEPLKALMILRHSWALHGAP